MPRGLATSLIGLTLGWASLYSLPGYRPFTTESGYKPYVYVDGYKPYIEGKGYKPYGSTSSRRTYGSSSSRAPREPYDCTRHGWLLPSLIRGNEPLTFCQVKVNGAGGVFGSDWLSW